MQDSQDLIFVPEVFRYALKRISDKYIQPYYFRLGVRETDCILHIWLTSERNKERFKTTYEAQQLPEHKPQKTTVQNIELVLDKNQEVKHDDTYYPNYLSLRRDFFPYSAVLKVFVFEIPSDITDKELKIVVKKNCEEFWKEEISAFDKLRSIKV